eukprot:c24766_g19_i1 orf=396-743(+)
MLGLSRAALRPLGRSRKVRGRELSVRMEKTAMNAKGIHHKSSQGEEDDEKDDEANISIDVNSSHLEDAALVSILKTCVKQKDLCKGSRLHADICKRGLFKKNIYLGNTLVNMYAK